VSKGFQSLGVPTASVTSALRGTIWLGTVIASDKSAVRVESLPLRDNGVVYGVLQVGTSATSLQATLRTAAVALFGVAPLLLLLGAAGSYWLARRALRPVLRVTRSAREIESHDLHRRVPVPRARDEVQDLALTLNGMIERLERAFDQQRRFVADASHELRTPVAAIQSLTDVALTQPGTADDYADVLRAVNSEAERLGALIGDLLALARADEGQVRLEHDPVRLDLLAAEVVAVVEPLATEREVRVAFTAVPATVRGDEARLIQMLLNLVDNAIHYTPAGGLVTVEIEMLGGDVRLSVRDTGRGIAAEHLPHVFERFYRADPARRRSGSGGSGLGRAIVAWVVQVHQGQISVESRVGEGSTFTVRLPRATEDVPEPSEALDAEQGALPPLTPSSASNAKSAPIHR
ncbi:MAG: sensor histidine kinase, partial [Ktedonobacterales bacterium]